MENYLIDTHAHIDMLEDSPDVVYSQMLSYGVKKAVIPAVEKDTLDKIIDIANQNENFYAMVGIFPSEAKTYDNEVEEKIITLAENKKVKAVGEIGLDYYWDKSFKDLQKEIFIKQIKIANRLNLPIVVHDRDAHQDTFDILARENLSSNVLFHCFSGSVEFMKECVNKGYYIAIGGVVTFKNAKTVKEVAKHVPLQNLVLETDSPYLTPEPYRGKPNKPAYVKYVAEEIAKIKEIPLKDIINVTTSNAEEFFRI